VFPRVWRGGTMSSKTTASENRTPSSVLWAINHINRRLRDNTNCTTTTMMSLSSNSSDFNSSDLPWCPFEENYSSRGGNTTLRPQSSLGLQTTWSAEDDDEREITQTTSSSALSSPLSSRDPFQDITIHVNNRKSKKITTTMTTTTATERH